MKLLRIAPFLLVALALAFPATAWAEDEEGEGQGDLKERIKKKMEKILELMRENEAALVKVSTGEKATVKKVDVPVPEGEAGATAKKGDDPAAKGKSVAEKLEDLISGTRKKGGSIPDELKQLVEMIPL